MITVIAAVITAAASVAATLITVSVQNSKAQAVTNTKIDNLTAEVEKHNNVVERVFKLEEQNRTLFKGHEENKQAIDELTKTANHASERADAAHNRIDRSHIDEK